MNTLSGYQTSARRFLDEASAIFYQDADLTAWINEAIEDICARAQIVQSLDSSIALVAGTAKYPLPADMLMVTRAEADVAGVTTPMYRIEQRLADIRFGSASSGTPQFWSIFGTPGQTGGADSALITVYPTPAANGTMNLYYERIPAALVNGTDTSLVPPGWDRLVVWHCVSQGLIKNRDFNAAQTLQAMYENILKEMITNSRLWSSESEFLSSGGRRRGSIVQGDIVSSPSQAAK